MINKNIRVFFIIIIISLFIIIGSSCFIFYREFKRLNNPIMAGIGLIKITILNMDYIMIQENPKVIIAKSGSGMDILEKYMNVQSFKIVERLGSFIIFENDVSEKQSLSFRMNRYYSIWEW